MPGNNRLNKDKIMMKHPIVNVRKDAKRSNDAPFSTFHTNFTNHTYSTGKFSLKNTFSGYPPKQQTKKQASMMKKMHPLPRIMKNTFTSSSFNKTKKKSFAINNNNRTTHHKRCHENSYKHILNTSNIKEIKTIINKLQDIAKKINVYNKHEKECKEYRRFTEFFFDIVTVLKEDEQSNKNCHKQIFVVYK